MSYITQEQWQTVGIRPHHGIALPLGSLHSHAQEPCGDFQTLHQFLSLLSSWGFDTLQLLPINDSGYESSPYMSLSSYALHPLYLSFSWLPNFFSSSERTKSWQALQSSDASPRFDFIQTVQSKWKLLCHYLDEYQKERENDPAFQHFLLDNESWLDSYSSFKALKEFHGHKAWWEWDDRYQTYPCQLPKEIIPLKHRFQIVQFLCYQQATKVKEEADRLGLLLKGDLPILQSKDSADVWANRSLFNLSKEAGAPPDMYAKEGQKWGFPLYNWKNHQATALTWWKERLQYAERFYHIYRLDHVVGFYRLFAISPKKKPKDGIFIPSQPNAWITQGEALLKELIPTSSMLPIGEDLGDIPDSVRTSMHILGIPGTKVMRWERFWKKPNSPFIPLQQYNPESVSMVSTHDSSTMRAWSQENPHEFQQALEAWNISLNSPDLFAKVLQSSHQTASLFHMNLFPEYLSLFPTMCWNDERSNRINIPGTVSPFNWTYRLKPSLERLFSSKELAEMMVFLRST